MPIQENLSIPLSQSLSIAYTKPGVNSETNGEIVISQGHSEVTITYVDLFDLFNQVWPEYLS